MTISIYNNKTREVREQEWKESCNIIHNNFYDYSESNYQGAREKIKIICPDDGEFWQTADSHKRGHGCGKCRILTTEKVNLRLISESRKISCISDITSTNKHATWKCLNHNCKKTWEARPDSILNSGTGCPHCRRLSNKIVDQRLKKQNRTIKRIGEVVNARIPILWGCLNKNCKKTWKANPHSVVADRQTGCPHCNKTQKYSKKAIKWLEFIAAEEDIYIKHAENDGEYLIPNTRYKVDGYCEETNTVYEFHGDRFHGNPSLFKPDENCHPYDNSITALELFQRTMNRDNHIKSLGFNMVISWESDYR